MINKNSGSKILKLLAVGGTLVAVFLAKSWLVNGRLVGPVELYKYIVNFMSDSHGFVVICLGVVLCPIAVWLILITREPDKNDDKVL